MIWCNNSKPLNQPFKNLVQNMKYLTSLTLIGGPYTHIYETKNSLIKTLIESLWIRLKSPNFCAQFLHFTIENIEFQEFSYEISKICLYALPQTEICVGLSEFCHEKQEDILRFLKGKSFKKVKFSHKNTCTQNRYEEMSRSKKFYRMFERNEQDNFKLLKNFEGVSLKIENLYSHQFSDILNCKNLQELNIIGCYFLNKKQVDIFMKSVRVECPKITQLRLVGVVIGHIDKVKALQSVPNKITHFAFSCNDVIQQIFSPQEVENFLIFNGQVLREVLMSNLCSDIQF